MDGVEKISNRILNDAQKQADKILNEAKAEASKLKADATAERKKQTDNALSKGKKQASAEKQRILSSANLQAHNLKLKSEETLIGNVFTKAMGRVSRVQEKAGMDYENALRKLVNKSIGEIGAGKIILSFSKKDQGVGKKLAQEFNASLGEAVEISGGVIVQTSDSSLRVDNSFEKILEREEDSLRSDIANILFANKK